jgi:hypothetical protein
MSRLTIARIRELTQDDTPANRAELAEMFWDWWGNSKTLPNKAFRFCKSLLQLQATLQLDEQTRVDLKENCPCAGPLYVSCQLHVGEEPGDQMVAWFTPKDGHESRAQLVMFWAGKQMMLTAKNTTELCEVVTAHMQR